jgi:AcrR family transcriptional regulator
MATSGRYPYHHGALRETLIDLALEVLDAGGAESVSLRRLAARAGVSGMAPYRHFDDKAALMEAVARRGFALLAKEVSAADALTDRGKRLTAFGVAYVEFALRRPGLFKAMFDGAPPTPDRDLDDPDSVHAKLVALIVDLSPPEKRADLILTCWAAMHGLACLCLARRLRGPREAPAALAYRVAETLQSLFNDCPTFETEISGLEP